MSGLLALLDDVAAIAKVAAASVDDVIGQAAKAGSKAAGAVIDDAAVTPKYVAGFSPARELPIVWRIAKGSMKNKLLFLLPVGLLLNTFLPGIITPLLMLGGAYLCFEGAEKIVHIFSPHHIDADQPKDLVQDPTHLEEQKVSGAIKTDFILSAEIMTIALSAIPESTFLVEAGALALVGTGVTVGVYGTVGLIVKMDDVGLYLARQAESGFVHEFGRALVRGMPLLMKFLSIVGTAAMLWVGGSIMVHGLHDLGMHHPYEDIHHLAVAAAHSVPHSLEGAVEWAVTALCDGILGIFYGLLLIPVMTRVVGPLLAMVSGGSDEAAAH